MDRRYAFIVFGVDVGSLAHEVPNIGWNVLLALDGVVKLSNVMQ